MKVTAEVVAVGQKMDFEAGLVVHTVELVLPDGAHITAPITEVEAERLLHLCVGADTQEIDTRPAPNPVAAELRAAMGADPAVHRDRAESSFVETADGDMTMLFGGSPIPPAKPQWRRPQVTKDEAGNPIVHGAVDPGPPLDDAAAVDEDGVRSA